jgi:phosphoribosylformimino-5-aminoimidazole carboxamide ribotide isomerase
MTDDFHIYPAIDLRKGRVVRLTQGRADAETVYGDDAPAVAAEFERLGAKWLHVVNLDGAFGEGNANLEVLRDICGACNLNVQFGGGLRTAQDVEDALKLGVSRVILGTLAVREPETVKSLARELGRRVAVGIDAKAGMVAVSGWVESSEVPVAELGQRMLEAGVERFIYTDIARDGMMSGPDLDGARALGATGAKVIASGGVGDLGHVKAARLAGSGVDGLIIGKALYEGNFSLADALNA